jgi:hypothetical protein
MAILLPHAAIQGLLDTRCEDIAGNLILHVNTPDGKLYGKKKVVFQEVFCFDIKNGFDNLYNNSIK